MPDALWPSREPPSAGKARGWTIAAALWLWVLLPVAIHYQRKARREAEESAGAYVWPHTIWNRPVLLWLIVLGTSFVFIFLMAMVGLYGP
jgi:hypothetical protein